MRSDASHSITMLKQKFDEIKRNINTIEQKQREFFSQGLADSKGFVQEKVQRPSSVIRFSDSKPKEPDRSEGLLRTIKELELDRLALYRRLEDYKKENSGLKDVNISQEKKIELLQLENQMMRQKLEKFEIGEKRPQSCIRDSKSPPKKNRVVFSKDLESVHPIEGNIRSVSPAPSRSYNSPLQGRGKFIPNALIHERLHENVLFS